MRNDLMSHKLIPVRMGTKLWRHSNHVKPVEAPYSNFAWRDDEVDEADGNRAASYHEFDGRFISSTSAAESWAPEITTPEDREMTG